MKAKNVKNCPVCGSSNIRKDYDFPDTMRVCNSCYSDFNKDGEVTYNALEKEETENKGTQKSPFGIWS